MFHIKGHRGTSPTFIFIKHVTIYAKISFLRKGDSNTCILPNTKQNMFTYHVLNQGAHSTFPFIKFTIQAKITFSRQGTFQDFHFTEYKTKYVHISRFKSRDKFNLLNSQIQKSIGQNIIFATRVIPIFSFYHIQNKICSHIMF